MYRRCQVGRPAHQCGIPVICTILKRLSLQTYLIITRWRCFFLVPLAHRCIFQYVNRVRCTMNTCYQSWCKAVRHGQWALKKAHMELLSVAQRKMEGIMLGITIRDHNRATWIRHQTGVNDIIAIIKKRMHVWAGHIARFKDNILYE